MKKILFIFSAILLVGSAYAQDELRKEAREHLENMPDDIRLAQYDNFKNTSYATLAEVLKTDTKVNKLKADMKAYDEGTMEVTIDNLDNDLMLIEDIQIAIGNLDNNLADLEANGITLVENATKIRPPTRILKATKSANSSLKAVRLSRKITADQLSVVKDSAQKIANYKKALEEEEQAGEEVEETEEAEEGGEDNPS